MTDQTPREGRKPRCWLRFGHKYKRVTGGYACARCDKPAKTCTNCGRQHDPNSITICIVESRS